MAETRFVKLLSIPKSFYVSGKLVGWKYAYKLPVMVRYNSVLNNLSGKVIIKDVPIKSRMLYIGFSSTGILDKKYCRSILEIRGTMIIEGTTTVGQGTKISIAKSGSLYLGDGFSSTSGGVFICVNNIHIGKGTAVAWDAMIMDTDWHSTMNPLTKEIHQAAGNIFIGDHCWIGTRCVVLKNTYLPNGCILAANSTANKHYSTPNTLIAGTPAIEKKHNITKSTLGDFQFLKQ